MNDDDDDHVQVMRRIMIRSSIISASIALVVGMALGYFLGWPAVVLAFPLGCLSGWETARWQRRRAVRLGLISKPHTWICPLCQYDHNPKIKKDKQDRIMLTCHGCGVSATAGEWTLSSEYDL